MSFFLRGFRVSPPHRPPFPHPILSLLLSPSTPRSLLTVLPALPEEHVGLHDQLRARQPGVVLEQLDPVGVRLDLEKFFLFFLFLKVEVEKRKRASEREVSKRRRRKGWGRGKVDVAFFFFFSSLLVVKHGSISSLEIAKRIPRRGSRRRSRKAPKGSITCVAMERSIADRLPFTTFVVLFLLSRPLTCTVLSGRSSPARRLICSRRRRFESCSRIFLRAILMDV